MRIADLSLFELVDVAEAAVLEPFMSVGVPIDRMLDVIHQAFYDADPDSWGEGPIASQAMRAMMSQAAPKRTDEEIAEMTAHKAARNARLRSRTLAKIGEQLRAYARNREAAE